MSAERRRGWLPLQMHLQQIPVSWPAARRLAWPLQSDFRVPMVDRVLLVFAKGPHLVQLRSKESLALLLVGSGSPLQSESDSRT